MGGNYLIIFALWLLYRVSSLMVYSGKKLQAYITQTRENHADAYAVQFTRNESALVSLLQKIYALQQFQSGGSYTLPNHYQHMQFVSVSKSHPPLIKRIQTYGGQTDLSFIESLYYRMQQSQSKDLTKSHQQTPQQNPRQIFNRLLITPIALPIIRSMLNNQADYNYNHLDLREALEQLTAILMTIENFEIEDIQSHCQTLNLDLTKIAHIQQQLRQKSHPFYWINRCENIAQQLTQQNNNEKKRVIDFLNKLVKIDGQISVHEFSYLLVINHTLQPSTKATDHSTIIDRKH